ncbi:MAG: homocysteine S-methyltransferase [Lysobacteraceae bacterium]|nr:MAG: homocysteine S-methyltransferase [Xanthomonadaceae bacterium]
MNPIQQFLDHQPCMILDGGLATALEQRGACLNDELWSARLLADEPQRIVEAHQSYLQAGADCITTASYQATVTGFMRAGHTESNARALLRSSVILAIQARDAFWESSTKDTARRRPLVAASVGPYGAFLADGSEYRGDYGLSDRALADFHRQRLGLLAEAEPDLLAIETIPSLPETAALMQLLTDHDGPCAWVGFCCRDGERLHDGHCIADAAALCDSVDRVAAVGINCTSPQLVLPLIDKVRAQTDKPVVVYPNSGERYQAEHHSWQSASQAFDWVTEAKRWLDAGAKMVGGCCRVGPGKIAMLRQSLLTNN